MIKTEKPIISEYDMVDELSSKWTINADVSATRLKKAFEMLEQGIKPRKVAAILKIHRNKIKSTG